MTIDYTRTFKAWAEAFTIFDKYMPDEAAVQPDHDIIYAGPKPEDVATADLVRLRELGWHPDLKLDCFYKFT